MNRSKFLKKITLSLGLPLSVVGCGNPDKAKNVNVQASRNKKFQWKMVTAWPPDSPAFGEGANLFAKLVGEMSESQLEIKVYGAGELIPALEIFDAVSAGAAEIGNGAAYYWGGKSTSLYFFSAIPFGMNAQTMLSWILSGGGHELWKQAYAPFNLVPFPAGNTGVQMGGWYNRKIDSTDDLRGLKMRIPGIGGLVLNKLGGTAVLVAGGEVYTSLERGVIDATEWVGPYHDFKMGFHKIAKFYYYPAWHEPSSQVELFVNAASFSSLPSHLQKIIEAASLYTQGWLLSEFESKNAEHFEKIMKYPDIQVLPFPETLLKDLKAASAEVIEDMTQKDKECKRVAEAYFDFAKKASGWSTLSEKAYYNLLQS